MKSIELFAGAGGLGIGLARAGFHPVQVIEWNKYCCDTLRDNSSRHESVVANWPVHESDVRDVTFTEHEGKIELVSGGPPCQPFSLGGRHKGNGDARDMFPQAIRALRESKPRAFIFENVKGLTRSTFRNYFEYIRLQMEHPEVKIRKDEEWNDHLTRLEAHHTKGKRAGLHYRVVVRLLNAADYGVPQRRERVVFVGFRDDTGIEWNFPEPTHSHDSLVWHQNRSGRYWSEHRVPAKERVTSERAQSRASQLREEPVTLPWRTVRDAFRGLPDPEGDPGSSSHWPNHGFQAGARSYAGHTGSPLDEPAKTLKAGVHGVPGGENMLLKPSGSVRYFTVRESARLQSFPDNYVFRGSWSEAMRQLGNAVPVDLATVIGKSVAQHLRDDEGRRHK
jgi:DNA (cytosine-5)-methyltransferase 1